MDTALSRYLTKHKISHSEMARRLGLNDSYVWRLAHGERERPTLEVALKLERATGGKVKASSWPHLRGALKAIGQVGA